MDLTDLLQGGNGLRLQLHSLKSVSPFVPRPQYQGLLPNDNMALLLRKTFFWETGDPFGCSSTLKSIVKSSLFCVAVLDASTPASHCPSLGSHWHHSEMAFHPCHASSLFHAIFSIQYDLCTFNLILESDLADSSLTWTDVNTKMKKNILWFPTVIYSVCCGDMSYHVQFLRRCLVEANTRCFYPKLCFLT